MGDVPLALFNIVWPKLQPTAIDDPKVLIELYRSAAINAKEAGFDGVECD